MRSSGSATAIMGESALARQSLLKAYQLRHRASDVERFYIETLYDRDVTGNLERERRTLETWAAELPARSIASHIAGGFRPDEHRPTRAGDCRNREGHRAGSRPDTGVWQQGIQSALPESPDDALLTVTSRERSASWNRADVASWFRYFVAFLKGDDEELARTAAVARKSPELEDLIPHLEALALARSGRLQDARRTSAVRRRDRAAVGSARTGRLVRSGQSRVGSVLRECGRRQAERQQGARAWQGPRRGLCRGVRAGRSQVICRNRAPSPRISPASSRRIRSFNSCICRRFGPCSH